MKQIFGVLYIILFFNISNAQYFHSLSNFYMNGQHVNPAYAGSREVFSSNLMYRNQWTGINGAPKTMNFGFHTPLKKLSLASGFIAFTDKIGVSRLSGLAVNYVYRIRMKNGKRNLAMGLKTGLLNFKADLTQLKLNDAGDPSFDGQIINQTIFDAGFGIYYYTPHFFFSTSCPILNQYGYNSLQLYDTISTKVINLYLTTGFIINAGDVELMPSIFFKSLKNDGQIDINFSLNIYKILLLGLSLRTSESIVFIIEYQINNQLRLGYAHDFITSPLNKITMGTHELTLRYELIKNYNVYSTRFF